MPNKVKKMYKIGAIDIGTNAVRLGIFTVVEFDGKKKVIKDSFTRVPLRLGHDAFIYGKISSLSQKLLIDSMKSFKLLMEVNNVQDYRAVATSALRHAENGADLVKKIEKKSSLKVKIIGGAQEARLTAKLDYSNILDQKKVGLLIDLGGGSTELSILYENRVINSRSFQIGTIRALNGKTKNGQWKKMQNWFDEKLVRRREVVGLAFGGNIKAIYRMLGKPFNDQTSITKTEIQRVLNELQDLKYTERVFEFGLKPDRADVLPPACKIFLRIMELGKVKNLRVPQKSIIEGTLASMI